MCYTTLRGSEDSMIYGLPGYSRNSLIEVGFTSQKNCITQYVLRTDVMNVRTDLLEAKGVFLSKGCVRYSRSEASKSSRSSLARDGRSGRYPHLQVTYLSMSQEEDVISLLLFLFSFQILGYYLLLYIFLTH
jgi:hypothetical protein